MFFMNIGGRKMYRKIYIWIKSFLKYMLLFLKKESNNKSYKEEKVTVLKEEKVSLLIDRNGVGVNSEILYDNELDDIERRYLMIIIDNYDIEKGYSEISISSLMEATNCKNRTQTCKIIKRLAEKNFIWKIPGSKRDANKYLILKHMMISLDSSIKIDTSTENDTISSDVITQTGEEVNTTIADVNNACIVNKDTEDIIVKIIKHTCDQNIFALDILGKEYKNLNNKVSKYLKMK